METNYIYVCICIYIYNPKKIWIKILPFENKRYVFDYNNRVHLSVGMFDIL